MWLKRKKHIARTDPNPLIWSFSSCRYKQQQKLLYKLKNILDLYAKPSKRQLDLLGNLPPLKFIHNLLDLDHLFRTVLYHQKWKWSNYLKIVYFIIVQSTYCPEVKHYILPTYCIFQGYSTSCLSLNSGMAHQSYIDTEEFEITVAKTPPPDLFILSISMCECITVLHYSHGNFILPMWKQRSSRAMTKQQKTCQNNSTIYKAVGYKLGFSEGSHSCGISYCNMYQVQLVLPKRNTFLRSYNPMYKFIYLIVPPTWL